MRRPWVLSEGPASPALQNSSSARGSGRDGLCGAGRAAALGCWGQTGLGSEKKQKREPPDHTKTAAENRTEQTVKTASGLQELRR